MGCVGRESIVDGRPGIRAERKLRQQDGIQCLRNIQEPLLATAMLSRSPFDTLSGLQWSLTAPAKRRSQPHAGVPQRAPRCGAAQIA
jgi:hypothetical protein